MSAPKRIQRKRTKGWRMPEGAVYVGRGPERDHGVGYRAEERLLTARQLTMRQVAIVFDDQGRVRSPIEQRQALERRPERTRPRVNPAEMRGALAALSDEQVGELARLRGYALVPLCAAAGCARPAVTAGMCASHNWRRRREERAAGT